MNIYESLASAIIVEHGAGTFCSTNYWGTGTNNRLGKAFWAWLTAAFGDEVSELPPRYRLPRPNNGYTIPTLAVSEALSIGLPLERALSPQAVCTWDHSVIDFATALLKHGGPARREMALSLLTPEFLLGAYSGPAEISAFEFAQAPKLLNPYTPADFGLEKLSPGLDPDCSGLPPGFRYVDSIGSGAWFTERYLHLVLQSSSSAETWFSTARIQAERNPTTWAPLVKTAARRLLYKTGSETNYERCAKYLNCVDSGIARDWLRQQTGASVLLWAALPDATTAEMAKGLKVIAQTSTPPVRRSLGYIRRDLTIEDFRRLTPLGALRILYFAPYARVQGVIQSHHNELSSMFFALTKEMKMVTDCMLDHSNRVVHREFTVQETSESAVAKWDAWASATATGYVYGRAWRNRLLEACEPSVAFLALALRFGENQPGVIPLEAIRSVLQSYPNQDAVFSIIDTCPTGTKRTFGLP